MKLPSFFKNFHIPSSYSRLFGTGAVIGPLVDGLHNQCLLEYHRAPLTIYSHSNDALFCTSLWVPPLLGLAYVILGGVLPRFLSTVFATSQNPPPRMIRTDDIIIIITLRNKAYAAVVTTALLIQTSAMLETQSLFSAESKVGILLGLALLQWAWLDRTLVALLVASTASIGGPWSELPFVAANVWEYISPDMFPLSLFLGADSTLAHSLGLNSITGPCYFAVTMDAIALGRWYAAADDDNDEEEKFTNERQTQTE